MKSFTITEEENFIRVAVRGLCRSIILWVVNQKPVSGYGLLKEIKRLTGQKLPTGILYPLLYELENKKLIKGEWKGKGKRRIKYYSITKKGKNFLFKIRKFFGEMPIKEMFKEFLEE
ncbi:hypothetical protein CW703_01295 [Candidatus Bathyarchaeota archaeon]|nr:MAG: hypothetical protein CW703_01295 [Candidatus Bathyarchaeota archaeon]